MTIFFCNINTADDSSQLKNCVFSFPGAQSVSFMFFFFILVARLVECGEDVGLDDLVAHIAQVPEQLE